MSHSSRSGRTPTLKAAFGAVSERVRRLLQPRGDGPPAEEGRNGGRLIPTRPAVRAKPSVCVEDERKRLCESLDSSASNSQHSLTSPNACSSLPTPLPTPPATRVRATLLLPLLACLHTLLLSEPSSL